MPKFILNFWDVNGKAQQIPFEGKDAQKRADELLSVIQEVTRNNGMLQLGDHLLQSGSAHAASVSEVFEIDPNFEGGARAALHEYNAKRFQDGLEDQGGPEQVQGFGPVEHGEEIAENTKPVQVDHTQS